MIKTGVKNAQIKDLGQRINASDHIKGFEFTPIVPLSTNVERGKQGERFKKDFPLTHAVNISRSAFSGEPSPGLLLDFLYIILLESAAFYIGIKLMKRRLIK